MAAEVTMFGDTQRRYVYHECTCPIPCCFMCHTRIDLPTRSTSVGQCPNPECVMWTEVIPVPDYA